MLFKLIAIASKSACLADLEQDIALIKTVLVGGGSIYAPFVTQLAIIVCVQLIVSGALR